MIKKLQNKSGIYCIINTINNKRYIGLTNDLWRRISEHRRHLKEDIHYNNHLQRAYNKYGRISFDVSILEFCDEAILPEREIYWIDKYDSFNNGYNQNAGGDINKGKYGEDNPTFNTTLFTFYHDEFGIEENVTKYYLYNKYNIPEPNMSKLINGKTKSCCGWKLDKDYVIPTKPIKSATLIHKDGTIEIDVSQSYMCKKYGLLQGNLTKVYSGSRKSISGWELLKNKENE